MSFLLDTHVFLWLQTDPSRLGAALPRLEDPGARLVLSAASSWEIAIKHGLGRLRLPEAPATYVPTRARAIGAELLAIGHHHALAVAGLPPHHHDPFDRLLVAQAQREGLTLVTADAALGAYEVPLLLVG